MISDYAGLFDPHLAQGDRHRMTQNLSIDQLRAMVRPLKNFEGNKIQHVKSKDWYVVTGFHFKEDDMMIWFSYETMHTKEPISFIRPFAELLDGRFTF